MPAIVMAQVHSVVHVQHRAMVQPIVQVVNAAILANPDLRIMARLVAQMSTMAPLPKTAARHAASHATTVITNPPELVWMMNVQIARNDVMSEFHKRVQAVYGQAIQNVRQIRSAVVEAAHRVVQISMFMAIHVKLTA